MPEHILRRYARGLMSIPPEISMADLMRMILYFVENNCYYSQQGNERARKKHDVRISLLILHRVVSFLQL